MFKKYNLRSYNYALVTLVVITSIFGLLIINSADSSYTVKQAGGIVMALPWMTFLSFVDYHFILKYYRVLYILLVLLLVGVKLFGVSAGSEAARLEFSLPKWESLCLYCFLLSCFIPIRGS